MSIVYFLGPGATKAVKNSAPLNDELLNVAFQENGYEDIKEEIMILKKTL